MSRVFLKSCEIALSDADLRHALMLWVERCTMASRSEYVLESFSLHPGNKYVVRMTVQPPAVVAKVGAAERQKSVNGGASDGVRASEVVAQASEDSSRETRGEH